MTIVMSEPRNLATMRDDLAGSMYSDPEPWRKPLKALRDRIEANIARSDGGAVWRAMSASMREVLCSLYTDSKRPDQAALQAWESFSEAERVAMGAAAREWRRQLDGAALLR